MQLKNNLVKHVTNFPVNASPYNSLKESISPKSEPLPT